MRNWRERHPIQFMALFLLVYLLFFGFLETVNQTPRLWLHCGLDDLIPFCKYAIVPYVLWFLYVPGVLLFLLWRAPRQEFWRLCLPLFAGMMLALSFCLVVPNGVALRPRYVLGSDVFARTVRLLWRADTSTNVCPSIHVFNSVMVDLAVQRCSCLGSRRGQWVRWGSRLLCVSIVLSTMLLKQHSVIDAVCGLVLSMTLDAAAGLMQREEPRRSRRALLRL